ncbi:LAGLIDADG family homing endonuclease [Tuberibacillus calidus]|uniref:LAGLIDADG family homing endonuclease n=1 Tax=Tuberibacillus calidus TaxID=340097 RepID=UPI0003F5FA82|nr:LAGLIDADG family homing endonuclease [Tuberibacillus calidus]
MYSEEQLNLARVAAFIDGEGCIRLSKRTYISKSGEKHEYFYPNLTIGMKSKRTIETIYRLIGEIGEVYEHKGVHIWNVHNEDVEKVLKAVYPFLITKKEQAKTILEYFKENANHEALYWKSRFEKAISYK